MLRVPSKIFRQIAEGVSPLSPSLEDDINGNNEKARMSYSFINDNTILNHILAKNLTKLNARELEEYIKVLELLMKLESPTDDISEAIAALQVMLKLRTNKKGNNETR